jgi:hypothetical protein
VRPVRRIVVAYRTEGAAAILHGNRGRKPKHVIPAEFRQRAVESARTTYEGVNDSHCGICWPSGRDFAYPASRCGASGERR